MEDTLAESERVTPPAYSLFARAKALLQLVRLPNVFSAVSNVLMGFLFTHEDLQAWPHFLGLSLASVCLYMAGMVLNDLYDFEKDSRERPNRPLPSGKLSLGFARKSGFGLLSVGVACAIITGAFAGTALPGIVAVVLSAAVVLYDQTLKRHWIAPVIMGSCRTLNVLLGMSLANSFTTQHVQVALGIGIFVTGLTMLARKEAGQSRARPLGLAFLVMALGLAVLALYPLFADDQSDLFSFPAQVLNPLQSGLTAVHSRWWMFWGFLGVLLGWRVAQAMLTLEPQHVQRAVRTSLQSLIILDAGICFSVRGMEWSIAVVVLVLPGLLLSRWLYST